MLICWVRVLNSDEVAKHARLDSAVLYVWKRV